MSDGNKRYADGLTGAADADATVGGQADRRAGGREGGGGEDGQRLSIYQDIFGNCEGKAGETAGRGRGRVDGGPKVIWAPTQTMMMLHLRTKRSAGRVGRGRPSGR